MAKKLVFDKLLFTTVLALVGFGLVMVYSASAAIARESGSARSHQGGDARAEGPSPDVVDRFALGESPRFNPFLVKQAVAAVVGLGLMLLAMHVDYRRLRAPWLVYLLLLVTFALLVLVLFGPQLNQTHRWLFVGGVSVQPSEIAKLVLIVFLAYQLERKPERVNQRELLVPVLGAAGLMALLVLLEPHFSAALVLAGVTCLLLFLGGLSWRTIGIALAVALPLATFAAWVSPYRRERLLTFLDPERDPLGSGFQVVQSLIAVGSGGVLGRGLGHGAQKLYFLPYPHTDFIFSIVGEELGLVGGLGLLALFAVVAWKGAQAGIRAPDAFGRYLAWGLTGLIVMQALIHCSVAVALFPPTGVPMPFLTYGGSALVSALVASGLVLNVSQHG